MSPKNQRLTITDKEAIKKINLIAAVEGKDPKEVAAEAVTALWEKKGSSVAQDVSKISPVSAFLENEENSEKEDIQDSGDFSE